MKRLALLLVALLACKSEPAEQQKEPEPAVSSAPQPSPLSSIDPNDPFAPYPGSSELCNRLIIDKGRPLHWRSWVTSDDWSKVIAHFKERAKGMPVKESTEQVEIQQSPGRVMIIYPGALAKNHPQCDKPLSPEDKTVVMVSEASLR